MFWSCRGVWRSAGALYYHPLRYRQGGCQGHALPYGQVTLLYCPQQIIKALSSSCLRSHRNFMRPSLICTVIIHYLSQLSSQPDLTSRQTFTHRCQLHDLSMLREYKMHGSERFCQKLHLPR